MLDTSDFKRGLLIEVDGKPWRIVDVSVNSPSARSGNLIVRTKMKSLLDGTVVEKPFRGGECCGPPLQAPKPAVPSRRGPDSVPHQVDPPLLEGTGEVRDAPPGQGAPQAQKDHQGRAPVLSISSACRL